MNDIKQYLAMIGRKGGLKSKRKLGREEARQMVLVREAKKAFKKYYFTCFWHLSSDLKITKETLPTIIKGLRNYGDREAFLVADKLCR